ncbi:hypothetical protein AB1N83_001725 [Pleurotus pulmonarius]
MRNTGRWFLRNVPPPLTCGAYNIDDRGLHAERLFHQLLDLWAVQPRQDAFRLGKLPVKFTLELSTGHERGA